MRVLQIAQKPQRRGAEVFAAQLGAWLAGAGHDVRHAYLYRYLGEEPLAPAPGDLRLERDQDTRIERLPFGNPSLLLALRQEIRRWAPDIVQANGGRSVKYAALVALLSPGRRWKLVYRNIDSPVFWVRGAARKLYFRHLVMPRIDGVVGVSRRTLAEVYDFYRLSAPGDFIPNGIDLAPLEHPAERAGVRADLGAGPEQVVVLFFGALTAQKRPERFVRLIRGLRDAGEDVAGWVLGDGEARGAMEALAAELGVAPWVRFLGYRQRVADPVAATDVLASTSDSEGIPAAVLEAGYLGVPAVGYDVGGMSECVRHGETGYLAPPGDEAEHLRWTLRLVRDAALRRRLGSAARAFVAETFSMDAVGRRYERFYERLLPGEAGPPEV
jgi:glycosyltransferase involved in cell wall biosynthesis